MSEEKGWGGMDGDANLDAMDGEGHNTHRPQISLWSISRFKSPTSNLLSCPIYSLLSIKGMYTADASQAMVLTIKGMYTAGASQAMGLTIKGMYTCGHSAPSLEIKYLRKKDNAEYILLDIKPTPLPLTSDSAPMPKSKTS